MTCDGCSGSGACDPCDGYGTLPDSYPNAGDGADCDLCTADGVCITCGGTGTTTNSDTNETTNTNEFEDVTP
jgi:molybdopterin biosynthesis enzyme MoaB